jgi:hypothetical protein
MNITMIDDSFSFDGATSSARAIGGAEKSFALLAGALSSRGHDVTVISRCQYQSSIEGVLWVPFDMPRPPESDVIIAFRKPELLDEFDNFTGCFILWMWGSPKILNKPFNKKMLEKYNPAIVFCSKMQRDTWKSWRNYKEMTILPGISDSYIKAFSQKNMPRPIAIVTTHPLHSLENILRLWRSRIYPQNKMAELHIYSASLYNKNFNPKLDEIYYKVNAARVDNVVVKEPRGDIDMASAYLSARVHLYPAITTEFYSSTLAETQACGTPSVIYTGGGNSSAAEQQVSNGQTAYIAPDDDAFVNLSIQLLSEDSAVYKSLSRDAKALKASRKWQIYAIKLESLWE